MPGAAEMLASDRFAAEVREDERDRPRLRHQRRPDASWSTAASRVSGAQPPEVLLELLRKGAPVS